MTPHQQRRDLIYRADLTGNEKLVLLVLSGHISDEKRGWAINQHQPNPTPTKKLALDDECGLSRETVNRTMKKLETKGIVVSKKNGQRLAKRYLIITRKLAHYAVLGDRKRALRCAEEAHAVMTEKHNGCAGEAQPLWQGSTTACAGEAQPSPVLPCPNPDTDPASYPAIGSEALTSADFEISEPDVSLTQEEIEDDFWNKVVRAVPDPNYIPRRRT